MTTVTRTLATYAARLRFSDLPQPVVEQAKLATLNILAAALGGAQTRIGRLHLALAQETGGGRPQATLIGDGTKVSRPLAAYANGNLAFAMDYEDVVLYTIHAGPIVIPAALAMAEGAARTGRDLIAAIVAGYEVGTRIGLAMQPTAARGSQVWGQQYTPFAACAAAGNLLRLSPEAMDTAFGATGTYATVPSAYKYFGIVAETRPMREVKLGWGWMSMAGTFGALSAQAGFRGGHGILDGREGFWIMAGSDQCDFAKMTEGLGERYVILDTEFKVHPSIAWNHPPHTALKKLIEDHDIRPEQIEAVTLKGLGVERIGDFAPAGAVDAQFSLPYTVATTLLRKPLTPALYSDATLRNPAVRAMLAKIRCEPDEKADLAWFDEHRECFVITVELKNGHNIQLETEYPRDKPAYGMKEIAGKLENLAGELLPPAQLEAIVACVDRLDRLKSPDELTRLLAPRARRRARAKSPRARASA
jgi:2-methylcitrate dehydratase PrpD